MIRRITIGILNLIILYLPPKKRQAKRIAWLQGLLYPYYENEIAFYPWRDAMIVRAIVTGQTIVLQWYLNQLFDYSRRRILIVHGISTGEVISLRSEGTAPALMSLRSETNAPVLFKLRGESSSSLPYDFRVICPVTVDVAQLTAIVKLYNMAHKKFDVITF